MKVEWDGKSYEFVKPMLVARLLEELSLNRDAHLVVAERGLI